MRSTTTTRQRRWPALTLAPALALVLAGCEPEPPPRAAVPAPARSARVPADALVAVAQEGADPRYRDRAVRALLINLIDDGDPPRFNDPQWPIVCGEGSTVTLDDRALEGGERVPDGSFTLEFALDGACPLGDGGPLLFGTLRMLVVRDDAQGLVPVVLAPH